MKVSFSCLLLSVILAVVVTALFTHTLSLTVRDACSEEETLRSNPVSQSQAKVVTVRLAPPPPTQQIPEQATTAAPPTQSTTTTMAETTVDTTQSTTTTITTEPTTQVPATTERPMTIPPTTAVTSPLTTSAASPVGWQIRARSKSVQEVNMCRVKYPDDTMRMLKRTLAVRGVRRVAIVGNFKDCNHVLSSIEEAILQVSDVLSPENVFVSFLESGSHEADQTPNTLRSMSNRFQAAGVSNVITTGNNRISAEWKPGRKGNRIDFLARLRNAAMLPAMSIYPEGHFDKFFFVNDVFICGGDILRLLAHDADIACGLDYNGEGDAIWDAWVLNTWAPTAIKSNGPIINVFSCWDGGMASRGLLWYSGVRFRRGMPELGEHDCSQSECSLWNMDAHLLGFHNIIVDPTVQVTYDWKPYEKNFRDSSIQIKESVESPNVNALQINLRNISYRCCELIGPDTYIDWGKCHTRYLIPPPKIECDRNATECLRYPPSRWEEKWDWNSLLKKGKH